jgi:hypothetical protein
MVMATVKSAEDLYLEADELLSAAEIELQRSKEDVVTHLICNNTRLCITHYLIGYLLEHNIPVRAPASIASLQHQCQSIDSRFHLPELDYIECRYETPGKRYCLEMEKVTACFKAAEKVRSVVRATVD